MSLSSDYVYRGVSLGDGEASPQLRLSLGSEKGFFATALVSQADIDGLIRTNAGRDTEVEYGTGYLWQLDSDWSMIVSRHWLEYKQNNSSRNNDYQETRVQFNYGQSFTLIAAHTDSLWNSGFGLSALSGIGRIPLPYQVIAEVEAGVIDMERIGSNLYPFFRVSLGRSIRPNWVGFVEYQYSGSNVNEVFDSSRTGSHILAGISYQFPLQK